MAEHYKEDDSDEKPFFLTNSAGPHSLQPLPQAVYGEDKRIDYLQDPSLWRDPLPQPYRLLNEILEEVLSHIYLLVREREMEENYKRKHKKKIPLTDEGSLISSLHGATRLKYLELKERELLFAGGGYEGIVCINLNQNTHISTPLEGPVNSISAQALSGGIIEGEVVLLAIGLGKFGGVIFIYNQNDTFNKICELEGVDIVQNVLLSKGGTYLAVTGWNSSNNDVGNGGGKDTCQVFLYSLPIDSWLQQLQAEQDSFNKPNFLFTVPSPSPLTPSPAADPIQAMKLIQERPSLPTGSCHGLTKTYLESRRNRFVSLRKRFITVDSDEPYSIERGGGGADVYFIHYWKREHFVAPKVLAIQWDNTTQLHMYVIVEKTKITTLSIPDQVYLQPSLITCTVVSSNSSFLAIGTKEGILSLTDLSTNILWGVVDFGSSLTCLCFVQSNASCVVMVGGCEDGRVTCVKWDGPENAQVTCLTRGYDVPKLVRELKCNTALPPTVTSLHSDRSLIIWDWSECVPLVMLPLANSFSLLCNPKGTLVTGSDVVALIAKTNDSTEQLGVFLWQLSTCEALRKTCLMKDDFPALHDEGNSKEQLSVCDKLTDMITSMTTVQLTI